MDSAREAARKGLHLGLAAVRHTGWWLRWHTGRHSYREVTQLGLLPPRTGDAERRAA